MFINRPIKEHLSRFPNMLHIGPDKGLRSLPIDLDRIKAILSLDNLIKIPCALGAQLNLDYDSMYLAAMPGVDPWAPLNNLPAQPAWIRRGTVLHIKRVVFDATTGATVLAISSDGLWANSLPLTLPITAGFAENCDFVVPPGYYLGLHCTDNIADISRSLTLWGEEIPLGVNGYDWGGTYIGLMASEPTP